MSAGKSPLRSFFRQSSTALISELIVALLVLTGLFGGFVAPYDPLKVDMAARLVPPGDVHPFGTDELGRDILSRVLYGARYTLASAAFVLALVMAMGIPVGAVAGFFEGWLDEVLMRLCDLVLAFPALILAMALVVAMGPGLVTSMIAVALVRWPRYARLVRAQVLTFKHRPFVEAARAVGVSDTKILVRHLMPNCLDPVLVRATVDAGFIILTCASLSFIGLGAQPPLPEWGAMVAGGRAYMINNWWVGIFPGLAIMLAVTGLTLAGDEVRDRLDPTLRGAR